MKNIIYTLLIIHTIIFCQDRKVLFIGIDGCRADALEEANTPNMDELISNGIYIDNALCSINGQPTWSGPGWSSMLTGVWYDKHGVSDNSFNGSNFDQYPTFNVLLEESGQEYHTASFIMWTPIHTGIFNGTMDYNEIHSNYNGDVALAAAEYIQIDSLDILFIDFDDVDHTGHGYGFSPDVTEYLSTIENVDEYIGWVIDGMESRPNYSNEEWLVIITSDHGGIMSGHGDQSLETLTIPIILSGSAVTDINLPEQAYIVDLVPTIIQYMGEEISCSWGLDGDMIGLNPDQFNYEDNCPECPAQLLVERNHNDKSIILNWTQNSVPGFFYSLYRNGDLLTQIDGQINQYIDYPNLIGMSGEAFFEYELRLESDQQAMICSANAFTSMGTGIILLEENFDLVTLQPAADEGLISDGGCTNSIPQNILGWTHDPPENWSIDNLQMPNSGTLEWRGWSFASKQFWVMAEDQQRGLFTLSNRNVAVADPDEWDDCENGADYGLFNSILTSPNFFVNSDQTIQIIFDSHFRNEPPQEIFFTSTNSMGDEHILLNYSNDLNDDNGGEDMLNEHLFFSVFSENDNQIQFNWKMSDAGNNWFWAIDNILIQIQTPGLGDINNDNQINIMDIVLIVNIILGNVTADEIMDHISDLNNDGFSNIVDIILLVNYILNT